MSVCFLKKLILLLQESVLKFLFNALMQNWLHEFGLEIGYEFGLY